MVDARRFEQLWRAHNELREDFKALVWCMETFGAVREPWMHWARFAATLKRFPLLGEDGQPQPPLADALQQMPWPLQKILEDSDWDRAGTLALREASSGSKLGVDAVQLDRLFVFGGSEKLHEKIVTIAESFDPCRGEWTPLTSAKIARAGHVAGEISMATMNSRIYILGGRQSLEQGASAMRNVECFDAAEDAWEPLQDMLQGRSMFCAVAVKVGVLAALRPVPQR